MSSSTPPQAAPLQGTQLALLDALNGPAMFVDAQGTIVRMNAWLLRELETNPPLSDTLTCLLSHEAFREAGRRATEERTPQQFDWTAGRDAYRVAVGAVEELSLVQLTDITLEVRARIRLAGLHELSSRLSGALQPGEVVHAILTTALPLLSAVRGAVFTFNRRHDKAHLVDAVGFTPDLREQYTSVPLHASPYLQKVVGGGRAIVSARALREHLGFPPPLPEDPTQLVILPLVCDGRVGGALSLSFEEARHFDRDDLAFMDDVAAKCGQALRRAGLMLDMQYERDRFEKLIEAASQYVWWTDPQGNASGPSTGWEDFTGRHGADLPDAWIDSIHPEDREQVTAEWRRCLESLTPYDHTHRVRRHDGQYRVMRARATPVYFNGRVREWMGVNFDVTEQALAEQQLRSWNHELEKQVGERTGELERAVTDLRIETEALKALAEFMEAAAKEDDPDAVVQRALDVIQRAIPNTTGGYLVREGELWRLRSYTRGASAEHVEIYRQGVPLIAPDVTQPFVHGEVMFLDRIPEDPMAPADRPGAVALAPIILGGVVHGMLGIQRTLGLHDGQPWADRHRAVIRAVAHALNGSVQRVRRTQDLQRAHAALQADTDGLKALAAFLQAAEQAHDALEVVQGALHVLAETLPGAAATLFTPEADGWEARLVAGYDAASDTATPTDGLPSGFRLLLQTVAAGDSFFFDRWSEDSGSPTADVNAVAVLPVQGPSGHIGALAIRLPHAGWSERDRAVVRSVTGALSVAVQRVTRDEEARQAQEALQSETDALKAFAAFTQFAGQAHDVSSLAQHAMHLLMTSLGRAVSAAEYSHDAGIWKLDRHEGYMHPEVIEEFQAGFRFEFPEWEARLLAGETLFFDEWPPAGASIRTAASIAAFTPIRVSGRVLGMITVGLHAVEGEAGGAAWTARDRAIVAAVGRALSLAAERAEREMQLEQLNAELDAFAQTVSHDLRAPVRHVRGFAGLAEGALRTDRLDQVGEHLGKIQRAAEHADVMIDALLRLAREAQAPLSRQEVSLDALVREAQALLEAETAGRNVRWEVGRCVAVHGDVNLLRQVVLNLLANAVKYTRDRDPAVIRVEAEPTEGWVVLRVADNGAGFDPRYAGRLFRPFQRLHRDTEFTGTGVGLVSVARIVKRHGGRVEAHGEVGRGATFTVHLPN